MAYDWSGNTVKQQRDDWFVIVALVALALFITIMPLAIMHSAPPASIIETTATHINPAPLKT